MAIEQARNQSAIAVVKGPEISRDEFLRSGDGLAAGIRASGVQPGDCLVVAMENSPQLLLLAFAALQVGVYLTPVNPRLSVDEFAYILGDCKPNLVVADGCSAASVLEGASAAGVARDRLYSFTSETSEEGYLSLDSLIVGSPKVPPLHRVTGELMFYTSGTTGRPKAVRRPLTGALPLGVPPDLAVSPSLSILRGLAGPHLTYQPLFFKGPLVIALGCLHAGRQVVLGGTLSAEAFLEALMAYRIASVNTDPYMLSVLLQLPSAARDRFDPTHLRHVIHSGAPCPVRVKREMIGWWGPILSEVYGTTEGTATYVSSADWLARPGTVGRAVPGGDIRILDTEKRPCPPGVSGDVYIKTPRELTRFEYLGDPAKTGSGRVADHFTVGDTGYLDDEGWLFLTGRGADIINSAGLNVYGAEVENVIYEHADVAGVAVIGIPSAQWGEEVRAVIELRQGAIVSPAITDEIMATCRRVLAPHKRPMSIEYRDSLPRSERGKLLKQKLRDEYWGTATPVGTTTAPVPSVPKRPLKT